MSERGRRAWTLREMLEVNRYRPLRWPIKVPGRFVALCLLCNKKVYVSQAALRRDIIRWGGAERDFCAHINRHLVDPPTEVPAPSARPDREADARKILALHRFTPIGPYPGFLTSEWACECQLCGAHVWVTPAYRSHRKPRMSCSHRGAKTIKPAPARRLRAIRAENEMKRKREFVMSLCAHAPHPAPPDMLEIMPPLKEEPVIAEALAAVAAECLTCGEYYRRSAGVAPDAVHFTLALFLTYTAIALNAHGREPGDNADAMVEALAPRTHQLLSAPTRTILLFLPVRTTTDTPDGSRAATWDRDVLGAAVAEIPPAFREMVWRDAAEAVAGILWGESRARQVAGQ